MQRRITTRTRFACACGASPWLPALRRSSPAVARRLPRRRPAAPRAARPAPKPTGAGHRLRPLALRPAPAGTGPASTATRPPAARRCGRARSASPTEPALRHHGQVRLPRPVGGHPGDRPRPLRQRPRLGPDQRRQRSARLRRRGHASATRSRSTTPPAPAATEPAPLQPLRGLTLPCSGSVQMTRGAACMSRFSRGVGRHRCAERPLVGARPGPGRLRLLLLVSLRGRARRRQGRQDHGGARPDRDRARPLLPGAALPGDRQRHRLPGQQRPDQPALPSSRNDGTIKAWTLTLAQPTNSQRTFFNGFFGTPPEARLAILRRVPGTNPPRYNLRSQGSIKVLTPLPRADGQVRRQPEGRKGRHRRHHRADLGARLLPGPDRQQRLARQPRTGQPAPTPRTSARASRRRRSAPAPPTAANTPPRACSTRRRWSRVARAAGRLRRPGRRPGSSRLQASRSLSYAAEGRTRGVAWSLGSAAALAIRLWNSFSARCADRLEDLLVGPADLPRLLVEVERGGAARRRASP